jgi:hypothetical protein
VYTFSASIMVVTIALLVGVFDFASLVMIFALTSIMSLLGLGMELRNQGSNKVDWANYTIGVLAGLVPWLILLIYIWNAHVYGSGVPGYVYWIYGSLLILFASFAINMYFQYKKLAWQVFAGTLR